MYAESDLTSSTAILKYPIQINSLSLQGLRQNFNSAESTQSFNSYYFNGGKGLLDTTKAEDLARLVSNARRSPGLCFNHVVPCSLPSRRVCVCVREQRGLRSKKIIICSDPTSMRKYLHTSHIDTQIKNDICEK